MATMIQPRDVGTLATRGVGRRQRFRLAPYLFILPHLIFFALFIGYPFFRGLYISLLQYDYLRPDATVFVGLDNYTTLFTPGSLQFQPFWNAMINTLQFVVYSVPLLVVIPLILAVLLNTKLPGRNIFRAIYFAPWVLSSAVVALLWWWIFQSQGGLINYYAVMIGLPKINYLSTLPWAWVAIVVCTVWWTMGFNMIILIAALQDIPDYLYEAGAIDGANSVQMFFSITLPLLRSVLIFIITITIIASFNLFAQPFLMTGGGPARLSGGATEPIMLRIYRDGFERNAQGVASAMSFVVAAVMILISFINFRVFQRPE